jgi:uncharacterized cupredoxin-like copper-binding protein
MKLSRRTTVTLLGSTLALAFVTPALAAGTTINVSLWDTGPNSMDMMAQGMMIGMAMPAMDMGKAPMGITLDMSEVPAGEITFAVTNDSKDLVHEMVLAPVSDVNAPLPFSEADQKVDEDAAGHIGEVAELEAGAKGALTVTLEPGTYILYCNLPGHYMLGMWALLTVTA